MSLISVLRIRDADPGCLSRIPGIQSFPARIPDPRVKKSTDSGSGSATLVPTHQSHLKNLLLNVLGIPVPVQKLVEALLNSADIIVVPAPDVGQREIELVPRLLRKKKTYA
jgi:hypothetical protein